MLRRLLTLLAVISGLTLAGEPAKAMETSAVSMAQLVESAESVMGHTQGEVSRTPKHADERHIALAAEARPGVTVPSVIIQVDRAHE